MNLAQPEGEEGEEQEEGGGGMEQGKEPAQVGCLPAEEEGGGGHRGWEQQLSPELQQGYRILSEFLLEKHRPLTAPFLRSFGGRETEDGQSEACPAAAAAATAGSCEESSRPQPSRGTPLSPGMGLLKMEEKFSTGQYEGITDFVADFRSMLERCYRLHGVDHWVSKQAQKLEMMLEQKLALLSRHLREKTAIAVTSKGFYGLEDEKGTACTSTRRRSTPRSLAGLTTGVFESVMVQVLRQEEQLRAKEEKRLREQERKEAEEASQKEIEEWEKSLLSQAAPTRMENMWEIPAIGHFLCLAQYILNLPEIVFYELERCLLMPQCSAFLSKIMTSLLSPPHRRSTLHRRPTLPYRTWEAALRQKVQQWYTAVGQTDHPDSCAEKLGLCPQFFKVLGEANPLEEKPFHELPFSQKVWLLKGLCDFVYETQKDVQDAVLGQPIHECREVILGYDYLEYAYVHFPQFCGADVRIYKQKPLPAPEFPVPSVKVKRVPRIKLEKLKYEYVARSSGESAKDDLAFQTKAEPGENLCSAKIHSDLLNVMAETEIKSSCEENNHKNCDFVTDCCKENRDKVIIPEEHNGFGEPLSPGEIRIVENGEKYVEPSVVKTETTPLKENTLKMCVMHVNGNHSDNSDINCYRVHKDVTSEHSIENKTLKFSKVRAKKKKKKKKKLKDIWNENLQRKREIHLHSLKSYKPEIQNKLLMMKKKAKHKKHKSGKKSISKKVITKKRKSAKPTVPEFQLICTNLDELRELIRKIENELKDVENIKKKSGRWYHRKQAVKELQCTLIRLLNELLPWEPKLMKAFQRNRSRLKKDYDDFKKQPDHDKFTREQWINEDDEIYTHKDVSSSLTSEPSEPTEFLKRNCSNSENMKLAEVDFASGKSKIIRKELNCKEIQKIMPKYVKRQLKQNIYLDDSTNEFPPRKKLKLSTSDSTPHSIGKDLSTNGCLDKKTESSFSEALGMTDSAPSTSNLIKRTKPIQALIATNTGNKVTLTSQLPSTVGRSISTSEKLMVSTMGMSPVKPVLPCPAGSKSPLHILYKMPGGHCMPIDLHNNSVKIQMQSLADCKSVEKSTGEKIMQQVLILPKKFLIHHRENKSGTKEITLQQKTSEQRCISLPQPTAVNTTVAPVLPTSTANAAATFLPGPNFKKNTTHWPQGDNVVNSFSVLSSSTRTSNALTSAVKTSQSESTKTKTVVLAASSSASSNFSSTVQPLTTTLPQSVSACISSSSLRLASPPKSVDMGEAKQELKTICIRDSQSILVTTRGGNTGIVKVQTNADQVSLNNLSPSSAFAYTPQLQAFLVPKSTPLSTSTFSTVTTTTPCSTTLIQSSYTTSASTSAASPCINQAVGKNMSLALGQQISHINSNMSRGAQKTLHVSSPTFLSPMASNVVMPTPSNNSGNAVSISSETVVQNATCASKNPFTNQQITINSTKHPITQPESMPITCGNVMSGAQIQKLMLVTNPPLLPACGTAGVNLIPVPTSSSTTAQKLVFINTPLGSIQPNASLTADSFKQTFSPVSKTYVKSTEQPQLVLIPSTVGATIKVNTSPTVSQIKDVKIGLNIGQAIINNTGKAQSVPPINIMQSTASKDAEDKNSQGVIVPLLTSGTSVPVCSGFPCQSVASDKESLNVATGAISISTVTANTPSDPASLPISRNTSGTTPVALTGARGTSAKVTPILTNRLRTSNVGNAMAISTVKTGHLASSVLISATEPAVSHPSFQLPVTVALPGLLNGTPKMVHTVPQLPAVPPPAQSVQLSKGQQPTVVQFQSTGIPATVPINGSAPKTQKVLPPNVPNTGKVVSFSNIVPLPGQLLPPNFTKPVPAFTCVSGASTTHTLPVSSSVAGKLGEQLNESCIQQKIIINTCTPLAPGTQIMINGAHFIVPPQGLGAGSHILLISTNTKLTPVLTINNKNGFQGLSQTDAFPQKTTDVLCNVPAWQPSKQPLKSFTKIVNSLGSADPLPVVRATPQIMNNAAKPSTPSFATTLPASLVNVTPSTTVAKTSLTNTAHTNDSQLQPNTSVLQLDSSIEKLMISPEGAILNAVKTSTSKNSSMPSSFSPDIISTTGNPAVVFPNFLNSSIVVPDTAGS